jgi:zinc finger protein ubi-d4
LFKGAADTSVDSKDSQNLKEEIPKDWYYDEIDINEMDNLDEAEQGGDSDYDYNINGYRRKRKRDRKPTPVRERKSRAVEREPVQPQFAVGGETAPLPPTPRKGRPPGSANGSGTRRGSRRGRKTGPATTSARKFQEEIAVPIEPPSFESALANISTAEDGAFSNDLRNYRKYI